MSVGTHRPELLALPGSGFLVIVVEPEEPAGEVGRVRHRGHSFSADWEELGAPFPVSAVTTEYGAPADHRATLAGDEVVVTYQTLEPGDGGGTCDGPAETCAKSQSLLLARFSPTGTELFRGPIVTRQTDFDEDTFPDHCILWRDDRLLLASGSKNAVRIREVGRNGDVLLVREIPVAREKIASSIGNGFFRHGPRLALLSWATFGIARSSLTLTDLLSGYVAGSTEQLTHGGEEAVFPTASAEVDGAVFVGYIARESGGDPDPATNPYYPRLLALDPAGERQSQGFSIATSVPGFSHVHPSLAAVGDRLYYAWSRQARGAGGQVAPQVVIESFALRRR
ncbi:MAG: hypothetical protein HYV63_28005 [Candidatus Schekmanbacteria bacterium]|nr:hypothetical protein [Candidatus Schekmanbacteria bacterium]